MKQNPITRRAFALSSIALAALALSSFAPRASAENAAPSPAVKNGEKIAFLGKDLSPPAGQQRTAMSLSSWRR